MSQKLRMAKCSTTGKCSGFVMMDITIRRFTRGKGESATETGSAADRCDIR